MNLTPERLKALLRYDEKTGEFFRLGSAGGKVGGTKAGALRKGGYVTLSIDGVRFYAHRAAWLYIYGRWPKEAIDHRNGNRSDNRIENLRECETFENHQNSVKKVGVSGYTGVVRKGNSFAARIRLKYKVYHLGMFATAEDAHIAYLKAKREMHTFQPTPRSKEFSS